MKKADWAEGESRGNMVGWGGKGNARQRCIQQGDDRGVKNNMMRGGDE